MPLRTITSPGVEIHEIDKSGYTQAMTGTAVYLKGFSPKGEAYKPFEVTTRSAFEQIFGTPDTEAERYFYAGACETLNQGGRLYAARLPYDNEAFEKMVGIKYNVKFNAIGDTKSLVNEDGIFHAVNTADNEIKQAAEIVGGKDPSLYDLSAIDEYRTDEAKVPANTFLIVDTTGATYNRVPEDSRKGYKREVIGIVPVVTTAANAMYVQNLLSLDNLGDIRNYESIAGQTLKTLVAKDAEGEVIVVDNQKMETGGLSAVDTVKLFNTEEYFNQVDKISSIGISVAAGPYKADGSIDEKAIFNEEADAQACLLDLSKATSIPQSKYSISSWFSEYIISGESLQEVNDWFVNFYLNSNFTTAITAFEPDNLVKLVREANERSEKIGYACKLDAKIVGLKLADMYVNTMEVDGIDVSEYVSTEVIEKSAMQWHPYIKGYRTAADRDEAFANISSQTSAYHVSAFTPDNAGKDVYAVISAVSCINWLSVGEDDPRSGWHGVDFDDSVPETLALDAANYFSTIQPAADGEGFDPDHLKDVGVVVYKAYLDPAEGNKVSFEAVEAYCGSLFKDDKDPNTGVTKFLDTIINSQSRYINFFSNCFSSTTAKKFYKEDCDIILANPSQGACLGLYSPMTKKDISISKSILDGMNKCFDKVEDINKLDIDIVPDAGLANIASYIKAIFGEKGPYDLAITDDLGNSLLGMWTCKKATDAHVKMWKTIEMKHDNFCKNIRKDCMFIADGLRPLVLQGQKKIVRDTKPTNSIDKDILPFVPAICGLNTSYGAGYMDWFEQADDYTGDFFWCPPSIKATGTYINTDLNYDYWLAPAGLTRGIIAATDVAFSPTSKQSGPIYEKNWNYAVNYPQDGIVLEGQKTFQTKPTALDRVNVRRTMLRLERAVYKTLRYYVYEAHTAYTRQRVVDAIEPILKACWKGGNGGIQRYKIVCDEKINDANAIDNNELKVQIGIVPTKAIEFIMVDFVLGNQSSTWAELLG